MEKMMSDPVDNPAHYQAAYMEAWDAIILLKLPWLEGNIVKYLVRHRLKGESLQDLHKARAYLDKLITVVEVGKLGPADFRENYLARLGQHDE
tara:strand:+ start:483 stop:761 length:279 start_codon:yes stop_codon:yes gene_type:complete